jgi:hypothetical protein
MVKVGDLIRVTDTGLTAPLHIGNTGVVIDDSRSNIEVQVMHPGGVLWWSVESIEVIHASR